MEEGNGESLMAQVVSTTACLIIWVPACLFATQLYHLSIEGHQIRLFATYIHSSLSFYDLTTYLQLADSPQDFLS